MLLEEARVNFFTISMQFIICPKRVLHMLQLLNLALMLVMPSPYTSHECHLYPGSSSAPSSNALVMVAFNSATVFTSEPDQPQLGNVINERCLSQQRASSNGSRSCCLGQVQNDSSSNIVFVWTKTASLHYAKQLTVHKPQRCVLLTDLIAQQTKNRSTAQKLSQGH